MCIGVSMNPIRSHIKSSYGPLLSRTKNTAIGVSFIDAED